MTTQPTPENEGLFMLGPATLRVWDAQGRQRIPRTDADTLDGFHKNDLNHNILSTTHLDTLAASVVRGDLLVGNATPKWAGLPKGAIGTVLVMGANDPGWVFMAASAITGFAAPSNTVKLAAVEGAATTVLRSDATLALDQSIIPTWTELHTFNAGIMIQDGDALSWSDASMTRIEIGYVQVNGGICLIDSHIYQSAPGVLRIDGGLITGAGVGVGTANPDTILHAKVANATAVLRLERDDTTIGTNDIVGRLEVEGQDAGAAGICAKLEAIAEGNDGETGWRFSCGIAGSPAEVMRLDYLGNVGVGETEPDARLHLKSATGPAQRFTRDDTVVTDDDIIGRIEFETRDAAAAGVAAYIQAEAEGSSGEVGLAFATGTSATIVERMRIGAIGSVMVGTTTDGMTAGGSLAIAQDLAHRGTHLGFYNTAPVHKGAHIADATGAADVITRCNAILAQLEAYGLLATA